MCVHCTRVVPPGRFFNNARLLTFKEGLPTVCTRNCWPIYIFPCWTQLKSTGIAGVTPIIAPGDLNTGALTTCGTTLSDGTFIDPGFYSNFQQEQGYTDFTAAGPGSNVYAYNPCSTPTGATKASLALNNLPLLQYYGMDYSTPNVGLLKGYSTSNATGCPGNVRMSDIQMVCNDNLVIPVLSYNSQYPNCDHHLTFSFNCALSTSTPYIRQLYYNSSEWSWNH